jgi:hypothetical protein
VGRAAILTPVTPTPMSASSLTEKDPLPTSKRRAVTAVWRSEGEKVARRRGSPGGESGLDRSLQRGRAVAHEQMEPLGVVTGSVQQWRTAATDHGRESPTVPVPPHDPSPSPPLANIVHSARPPFLFPQQPLESVPHPTSRRVTLAHAHPDQAPAPVAVGTIELGGRGGRAGRIITPLSGLVSDGSASWVGERMHYPPVNHANDQQWSCEPGPTCLNHARIGPSDEAAPHPSGDQQPLHDTRHQRITSCIQP